MLGHLFQESSEGVAIAALDGVIVAANRSFCDLTGYELEELLGRTTALLGIVPVAFQDTMLATIKERSVVRDQVTTITTKSGTLRDVRFTLDLAPSDGEMHVIGILVDITDQLRAERALRHSEQLFRSLAESAVDAIVSADTDGKILFFNRAAERVFRRKASDTIGLPLTALMPDRYHGPHVRGLARYVAGGEPLVIGKMSALEGIRSDGKEFPIELSVSTAMFGDEQVVTAIIRDLTEQDDAARAIRELSVAKERQRLLDRMVDAVETERKSFAAELHDGPIQHLAAISLRLHTARKALESVSDGSIVQLAELEESLSREISQLRSLMSHLVPTALENYGLVMALRDLGIDLQRNSDLAVTVEIEDLDRLSIAAETALYRIAQEAVGNAVRHASAKSLTLSLSERHERVTLLISDDGHGFDAEADLYRDASEHFGLSIMRERAQMVGGRYEIESFPSRGTAITVSIPRRLG